MPGKNGIVHEPTHRPAPNSGDEMVRLVRDTVEKVRLTRGSLDRLDENDTEKVRRHLEHLELVLEDALRRLNVGPADRGES